MIELIKNIARTNPDLILICFIFSITGLGWFVKRLIGKIEGSIDKIDESIEIMDDRIVKLEIKFSKIATYHSVNHEGQKLD